MQNKTIIIVIGIIVLVLIAGYFLMRGTSTTPNDTLNATTTTTGQNTNTGNNLPGTPNGDTSATAKNSVVLAEHTDGNIVHVQSVKLSQPSYVTIYRLNSQGDATLIGHSALLAAGAHGNLDIQVDTPLTFEETIVAVLRNDDGDQKFDEGTDRYVTEGGIVVTDIDVVGTVPAEENAQLRENAQKAFKAQAAEDADAEADADAAQ